VRTDWSKVTDENLVSAIIQKRICFERLPDRATSSAPKAQSSVRLSVRVAAAHNLTSANGRARLNLSPTH